MGQLCEESFVKFFWQASTLIVALLSGPETSGSFRDCSKSKGGGSWKKGGYTYCYHGTYIHFSLQEKEGFEKENKS